MNWIPFPHGCFEHNAIQFEERFETFPPALLIGQPEDLAVSQYVHSYFFIKNAGALRGNEKSVQQLSQCRFHTRPVVRVNHSNEK